MSDLKDAMATFVKRVGDLAEHVKGNEQATKQSLIGPLFTTLGYDITDPRECLAEHRENFGSARSVKPIDWVFQQNGMPALIVEAKEAGKKLLGYNEQLGDYFGKMQPRIKLGVLTNGLQWKFFTDYVHPNVMDKDPFVEWDVLSDDPIPIDFLTLLQKSQFNPQLIRTFAQRKFEQNLLLAELTRLLEPSSEFIKLAIGNIETRKLSTSVIESWKPVLASAIEEWTKQRMLTMVLDGRNLGEPPEIAQAKKITTTKEEMDGYESIKAALGGDRPIGYTDTVSYFKVHFPGKPSRVVCRLYFEGKRPRVLIPVPIAKVEGWLSPYKVSFPQIGWIAIALSHREEIQNMGDIFRAAYDHMKSERSPSPEEKAEALAE